MPTEREPHEHWYASAEWTADPGWTHVAFELEFGHHFHFELTWALDEDEAGACDVIVKLHGDLDADGQYSVFSRSARLTDGRLVREPWQGEEVMQ